MTIPAEAATDTFFRSEMQVLMECAYLAGSRQVKEAAVEIFAQLQSVVGQDAAALFAWDPQSRQHVVVGNSSYDDVTLAGLGEPYARTEPHHRMLTQQRPLRTADLPYDYRKTMFYRDVLRPAGLDDGLTTCLFADDGGYAGMLHMSSESATAFDPRHVQLVSALTASLGEMCNLRSLRPVIEPVDASERASLVDRTGGTRSVDQRAPATCVRDPAFRRLATRLLDSSSGALSGLWPWESGWLSLRVERVQDQITHRTALLVVESPWEAPYGLSARELDILNGLAQGASNQRIALERVISTRTVTTHVERILRKLEQESRAGAAAKATREGLLKLDLVFTAAAESA